MKKKKPKTLREFKWRDEFANDRRAWSRQREQKLLAETTLDQRQIFIQELREQGVWCWDQAMKKAGIKDMHVAYVVYRKNSRPNPTRILVEPEKIR